MKLYGARASDVILAILVVAITTMLVIPVPTWLLDILLVLNLSFSLLLLLVGLYMPNSLALLAFPSLLLITTLFRLALNVASSRLILSEAYAGEVINAFGSFLIRGEVIVGVIIFTIVTIVNFIVIAKGSSRVSEVAARFTLDALPGKQMMIDSDLRANLINAETARQRREDLQRESMLYGSMDGAMKFVQGDAIAGFFVIFTNIIGGMYLGLRGGMNFSDAVQTYTVLTIGDGLVSQIPALLISVCAGLVVTRVASSERSTLGTDLSKQLFARPGAVFLAGVILILFGSLPGLPFIPFSIVGLSFILGSFLLQRRQERGSEEELPEGEVSSENLMFLPAGSYDQINENKGDGLPIVVALDRSTLFKFYRVNQGRYRAWWRQFQMSFMSETGLNLPEHKAVALDGVAPASFQVYYKGSIIASATVPLDGILVEINPINADILGFEILEESEHPLTKSRVFWARQTSETRHIAELGGLSTYDFFEYIGLITRVFFKKHPEEILSLSDVHASLKKLDKQYPGLIADALSVNFVSMSRLTELLRELVRQGLSVLEFRSIVESVASFCSLRGLTMQDDGDINIQELLSFVRSARKRQVISPLLSAQQTLRAAVLSDEVEEVFESSHLENRGLSVGMEPEVFERLHQGFLSLYRPIREKGIGNIALLCRTDLRGAVQQFLDLINEFGIVVAFEELPGNIKIEQVGVWGFEKSR